MPRLQYEGPTRVYLSRSSQNRKTGPIPVTITTGNTCPKKSCPWWNDGCYAENGYTMIHWGRLHKKSEEFGLRWKEFCVEVRRFPEGQLWRHNEGGDLPGEGEDLDTLALEMLVRANKGRRGFTYTHKPLLDRDDQRAVFFANQEGFTINRSADNMQQADLFLDEGIAPVVLVLPHTTMTNRPLYTPRGRKVVLCPALVRNDVQCITCKLCALPKRKSVIAFLTHGRSKHKMTQALTQLRLPLG